MLLILQGSDARIDDGVLLHNAREALIDHVAEGGNAVAQGEKMVVKLLQTAKHVAAIILGFQKVDRFL